MRGYVRVERAPGWQWWRQTYTVTAEWYAAEPASARMSVRGKASADNLAAEVVASLEAGEAPDLSYLLWRSHDLDG